MYLSYQQEHQRQAGDTDISKLIGQIAITESDAIT